LVATIPLTVPVAGPMPPLRLGGVELAPDLSA
jgi:hypothetical protein